MRRAIIYAAVVTASALWWSADVSAYSFSNWARDNGFQPGDTMPSSVDASFSFPMIDSLDGIGDFDWTSTPTTSLNLDDNLISSIRADAFDELTMLTSLELRSNQISSIESSAFEAITNLEQLALDRNRLTNIHSGSFHGLANLTSLMLSNNRISSIEPGDFGGLANLSFMNLDRNQLSDIKADSFDGLTNLTWLRLNYNQISNIESGAFSELTNLSRLDMAGNRIASVELGDLDGLASLTVFLDLSENQIAFIESGSFKQLTNLESIHMNHNQLAVIEPGALSGLTKLEKLRLDQNPSLSELLLIDADFSSLASGPAVNAGFNIEGNANISSVSLKNTRLNQTALAALMDGGPRLEYIGIGELDSVTSIDLSGVDFENVTDLSPLYGLDYLTELMFVNTRNLNPFSLDALLDNLAAFESTDVEGVLHLTRANYNALNASGGGLLARWDAEPGHRVAFAFPEPSTLLIFLVGAATVIIGDRRKGKRTRVDSRR